MFYIVTFSLYNIFIIKNKLIKLTTTEYFETNLIFYTFQFWKTVG